MCGSLPSRYRNSAELQPLSPLPIGKGIIRRQGEKVAILCFGTLLSHALVAAEQLNATVVDMRFVKPLDEALLLEMANTHDVLVTLENAIMGGAGSGVNEFLMHEKNHSILNLGLPDYFISQGTQEELIAELGLDSTGIVNSINNYLAK